ncbi:hypothetical protein ACVB8X_43170, partial [Streptomyces sp. NRAIS4]
MFSSLAADLVVERYVRVGGQGEFQRGDVGDETARSTPRHPASGTSGTSGMNSPPHEPAITADESRARYSA